VTGRALRAGALLALAISAQALGAEWNVAQLFDMLSRSSPAKATFHERKYLALLDRPLDSTGELAFTPPDRLEKRTLEPKPERLVAEGDVVTLERGGKRYSIALREQPAVAVLIESLRGTLAGNLLAVTRTFSVALEGSSQGWRIVLRPLDPESSKLVTRIEVSGAQAQVRTVEIHQSDGDRSVMTITPVKP